MSAPQTSPVPEARSGRRLPAVGDWTVLVLLRAGHPRRAAGTALAMAFAAAGSGRALREIGLVLLTVLVGQALLGWDNDLVDEQADDDADRPGKPVADGTLERGTVWFAIACALLLVVPLALSSGVVAGLFYLLSLVVGAAGNRLLRSGVFSWVPWALAFALYPAYLSYGGWGGAAEGSPPTIAITLLAALLGVGVHVLTSLSGLVEDRNAGLHHLPLQLALRVGAPRLLVISAACCAVVIALLALVGATVGLSR